MIDRIVYLVPEITLFLTICVIMLIGTSPDKDVRRATQWVTGIGLFFALIASGLTPSIEDSLMPDLARFVKMIVCVVGLLLLLGMGSVDARLEAELDRGERKFDPLDTSKSEFFCFFLLSLIGVMLCTIASDLIWLFLALELTSLPTYVMVATSRHKTAAHEASVKYFYLGALAAAIFLYGFAMLYGATGTMLLTEMQVVFAEQNAAHGHINTLGLLGLVLAIMGIAFKIAAFPMHFYAADVYDGAATAMSAFLAFVPKTAGFVVILFMLSTVYELEDSFRVSFDAWPYVVTTLLITMAILTMTIGNTLAILQTRTKRILAYSSIAHSGYILIGVIAGPAAGGNGAVTHNGFAAVVFYLLAYGIMNVGAFLVIGSLEREAGEELETLDDLRGIATSHPWLAGALAVCALSLIGLPPLIGFFGKLYLFTAGIAAGHIVLIIIAGLNSAVSAWYYLKLAGLPWLSDPLKGQEPVATSPFVGRRVAAVLSATGVIALVILASPLINAGHTATQLQVSHPAALPHASHASDDVPLQAEDDPTDIADSRDHSN